jgi:hypothetical protein
MKRVIIFISMREKPDWRDNHKRERAESVQSFDPPWRNVKVKRHNKSMYPLKWDGYEKVSLSWKKLFFEQALKKKRVWLVSRIHRQEKIK